MTNGDDVTSRVSPSGAARAAASVAVNVPAPGRFSTTIVSPCVLLIYFAIRRATMSTVLPAKADDQAYRLPWIDFRRHTQCGTQSGSAQDNMQKVPAQKLQGRSDGLSKRRVPMSFEQYCRALVVPRFNAYQECGLPVQECGYCLSLEPIVRVAGWTYALRASGGSEWAPSNGPIASGVGSN
jgi:hypothetical protein